MEDIAVIQYVGIAIDALAMTFILIGLWLVGAGYARPGIAISAIGVAIVAATAVLRGFPSPSVLSLKNEVTAIERKLVATATKLDEALADNGRLKRNVDERDTRLRTSQGRVDELERLVVENAKVEATRRMAQLTSITERGLTTKYYSLTRLPQTELVLGMSGTYLSAQLRRSNDGLPFVFAEREYRVAAESDIRIAGERLVSEVLDSIGEVVGYKVFLRGGADARNYEGPRDPNYAYDTILFLPPTVEGKYSNVPSQHTFGELIRNDDLPNLRAVQFRSSLKPLFPNQDMQVLGNSPGTEFADHLRTVEIVIYIP
jgi:hypothetical protein